MRYAFVFISIVAIWVAIILLAADSKISGLFLSVAALLMTTCLFLIGFRRGR